MPLSLLSFVLRTGQVLDPPINLHVGRKIFPMSSLDLFFSSLESPSGSPRGLLAGCMLLCKGHKLWNPEFHPLLATSGEIFRLSEPLFLHL